ncbi:rRNA-processing protein UTP23-like protein [Drosera capensis]
MRLKKQKRHRRVVRFYTACFGFREPFKVMCDGTFIHHLVSNKLVPFEKVVGNALGGSVKLFTTRCVIGELQVLGREYGGSCNAACKEFKIASCDHEKRVTAVACIMQIIGEKNTDHFFVGTQDFEMRQKLKEIPGVPVLYGLRTALLLEQPSTHQRDFVKSSEESRLHMTDLELQMLKKRTMERLSAVEAEEELKPDDAENQIDKDIKYQILATQSVVEREAERRKMQTEDGPRFKRKRAKGPNPLSCLKKKKRLEPNPNKANGDDSGTRSRSRKRKRSRGKSASKNSDD